MSQGRTERRREVLPFVPLDGYLKKIRYRSSVNAKFEDLISEHSNILVPVDDLRSVPRHELIPELDESKLPPEYQAVKEKLKFVVLVRDSSLRREHVLFNMPLNLLPDSIVLSGGDLKRTSCRDVLPLEMCICSDSALGSAFPLPRRPATRLTNWSLTINNSSSGAKFPWTRKSAAEFVEKGLPGSTPLYVHFLGDSSELTEQPELMPEEILEVWIHEDMWTTLQQGEGNPAVSLAIRTVASQVMLQILGAAALHLRTKGKLVDQSACDRCLAYLAAAGKVEKGLLVEKLKSPFGVVEIAPFIMSAYAVTRTVKKIISQED